MNSFCAGHVNDFRHFPLGLDGLEDEYDVGIKFEEKESDKFHVDPKTGGRVGAEPLLILYVSETQEGTGPIARGELHRWFNTVYQRTEGSDSLGLHGTPVQLRAGIEALIATGANHLLLNPVCRHAEQLEVLAEVIGLR